MKQYPSDKPESSRSRKMRWAFNFWPCIWCTGSKVEFIAGDFKELHVSLQLNIRTRNRVGTVYGGSIYSSVDPYFMLLFMEVLGKDYVVWDKGASMKFVKPIINKVKCRFLITDDLIEDVKHHVAMKGEYSFELPLKYEDDHGKVFATFSKSVYVANKEFYKKKLAAKQS